MAKWWYHIIHSCPGCGATWDEYDPKGGGYDSGLRSCPRVIEECEECSEERRELDAKENE